MQIKLDCCKPFKTYINQSLGQCSGIERKSQMICISVQQLEALFFLPQRDLKTNGEMKNAHDISMCVPHCRFPKRDTFVCVSWKAFSYYYSLRSGKAFFIMY